MKQRIMAFWKYDQPPYYLCGEVVVLYTNNYCETVEYGIGFMIHFDFLLPYDEGKALKDKLSLIVNEYELEVGKLHKNMLDRIQRQIIRYSGSDLEKEIDNQPK